MELSKETIMYLRYAHGGFNLLVALTVWTMLGLGLGIRRIRARGGAPKKISALHRAVGPLLVGLSPLGFFAGMTLIYADKGRVLEYPVHFAVGLLAASAVVYTFYLSRRLLGGRAEARQAHRRLGQAIAALYLLQTFLGIGILL